MGMSSPMRCRSSPQGPSRNWSGECLELSHHFGSRALLPVEFHGRKPDGQECPSSGSSCGRPRCSSSTRGHGGQPLSQAVETGHESCADGIAPPMRAGLTGNPSSNRMTSLWRQRAGFVSLPYSSLLTYPSGAPIRRATEGCSMNSLLTMQTLARAFGTSQSAAPCGDAAFQFLGIRGYVSCEREGG